MPHIRKRWLLLLLIPAGIAAIPVLLFGMLMGTRLLSMVAGPVNMFNTPAHAPRTVEIAGYYRLSKQNDRVPSGTKLPDGSGFKLGKDHRLEITDVPAFDDSGGQLGCTYNGTGNWSLSEIDGRVSLQFSIDASTTACQPLGMPVEILGHSRPYRIWYGIGDPDNDQGLTYELQNP